MSVAWAFVATSMAAVAKAILLNMVNS